MSILFTRGTWYCSGHFGIGWSLLQSLVIVSHSGQLIACTVVFLFNVTSELSNGRLLCVYVSDFYTSKGLLWTWTLWFRSGNWRLILSFKNDLEFKYWYDHAGLPNMFFYKIVGGERANRQMKTTRTWGYGKQSCTKVELLQSCSFAYQVGSPQLNEISHGSLV